MTAFIFSFSLSIITRPFLRADIMFLFNEAVPPMWKVLIVSWVPGSPMDWAAMIPTASPMLTIFPWARSRP